MDQITVPSEWQDDTGFNDGYLVKKEDLVKFVTWINETRAGVTTLQTIMQSAFDTMTYQWKDELQVTINVGNIVGADGLTVLSLSEELVVSFSDAVANTEYFFWMGVSLTTGETIVVKAISATVCPSSLDATTATTLRYSVTTNASAELDAFWYPFGGILDSVIFEYVDDDTFTIKRGGKFKAHDGKEYLVNADTDISIASDMSADVTAGEEAQTYYAVWGGEDTFGDLTFKVTNSFTAIPSELVKGKCFRVGVYNDASSNLFPFDWDGAMFRYRNVLAVYTGTSMNNAWVSIDFSGVIPPNVKNLFCEMTMTNVTGPAYVYSIYVYIRKNSSGETFQAGVAVGCYNGGGYPIYLDAQFLAMLDDDGTCEMKGVYTSAFPSYKISVVAFLTP